MYSQWCLLLCCWAQAQAWLQITPKIAETLGTWKLHDSTDHHIKHKRARLEIMPALQEREVCTVKFTIQQPIFLSTSVSQYVQGSTTKCTNTAAQLQWNSRKQAEVVFCGVGLTLASLDILTRSPKGNIRTVHWKLLNSHTLRVKYAGNTYLFGRTEAADTSILVPLELWLLMQLLSTIYAHHVHLNI